MEPISSDLPDNIYQASHQITLRTMVGLILWAIVILIIVICACPGFLTFLFCIATPVGIAIFALFSWIDKKING